MLDKKEIENIINSYKKLGYAHKEDFPTIDLYMEQVTSFIEQHLSDRHSKDKMLTKTMINNYAKNKLFPAPVKKKYNRDHLISFCIIYYLKNFLSIDDIKIIINGMQNDTDLFTLYSDMVDNIRETLDESFDDIFVKLNTAYENNQDKQNESIYLFIAKLSYDIYIRKKIIEGITDHINSNNNDDK